MVSATGQLRGVGLLPSSHVASDLENQAELHGLYNLASEVILLADAVISSSGVMVKGHRRPPHCEMCTELECHLLDLLGSYRLLRVDLTLTPGA